MCCDSSFRLARRKSRVRYSPARNSAFAAAAGDRRGACWLSAPLPVLVYQARTSSSRRIASMPVLVSDRVAVVGGAVSQPLDLVQRVDHPVAADVGPASADQVGQRLPVRGAGRAVVDPQLFQQPFGDLPDQRDRVLRIPVRQRADRPR